MPKLIVTCPHCNDCVIIEKKNCGIFRHAIYKKNSKQVDPHLNKKSCEELVEKNLVYGCCKPFKIVNDKAEICDYI